jgi:hypothetical protein
MLPSRIERTGKATVREDLRNIPNNARARFNVRFANGYEAEGPVRDAEFPAALPSCFLQQNWRTIQRFAHGVVDRFGSEPIGLALQVPAHEAQSRP